MPEITKADRDLAEEITKLIQEYRMDNKPIESSITQKAIAALFAKQREGWIEMLEQEKYSMPDTSLEVGYNEGLEAAIEILGGRP